MPKVINAWKCNICETAYFDEPTAIKCEQTHTTLDDLKIVEVFFIEEEKYPKYVMLDCEKRSGDAAIYVLCNNSMCMEDAYEKWDKMLKIQKW